MIERYFPQANVLLRLRSGPIGPYLPRFVSALEQRQFSRHSICRYIRVADGLCRWLDDQGVDPESSDSATPPHDFPEPTAYIGGKSRARASLRECTRT